MSFTDTERAALAPYFTNTDRPVFALVNLPETVKGALFARYSRSPKSLRRLFLDEFFEGVGGATALAAGGAGTVPARARIAPISCTSASSATTATTRWRSWAASTWPSRTRRTS